MKQLGNALVALVIMLMCAALSERVIPGVATQEASALAPMMIAADTAAQPTIVDPGPHDVTPRVPEYMIMLLVGTVLLGLGGAFRTAKRDR